MRVEVVEEMSKCGQKAQTSNYKIHLFRDPMYSVVSMVNTVLCTYKLLRE